MRRSLESRYSPVILQLTNISGSLFLAFSEPKKRDEKGARSLLRHSQIAERTRSGIAQCRAHVRGDMRPLDKIALDCAIPARTCGGICEPHSVTPYAHAREGTRHFPARCTLLAGVEATATDVFSEHEKPHRRAPAGQSSIKFATKKGRRSNNYEPKKDATVPPAE